MVRRKDRSIVRVSEGPTGVFNFVLLAADVSNLPTEGVGTGSIAIVQDTSEIYLYHEDAGWAKIQGGGGA